METTRLLVLLEHKTQILENQVLKPAKPAPPAITALPRAPLLAPFVHVVPFVQQRMPSHKEVLVMAEDILLQMGRRRAQIAPQDATVQAQHWIQSSVH